MPESEIKIDKFAKLGTNNKTLVVPYEKYIRQEE